MGSQSKSDRDERSSSDKGGDKVGPNHNTTKDLDCDSNDAGTKAGTNAHSRIMRPPSQPKRASSLRKPSRQALEPSVGTNDPVKNAFSTNNPRTHNESVLRPQPVSLGARAVIQRHQLTGKLDAAQTPDDETSAKPSTSLRFQSHSASGPIAPHTHPRGYVGARWKDVSASSESKLAPRSLPNPGPGQKLSGSAKLTVGKPQFSTFQQHFSPKPPSEAPVPPVSGCRSGQQQSSSALPETMTSYAGPGGDVTSQQAQTSRLQDELLQLQMIYGSCASQQKIYLENTMKKFKEQFAALSRDDRALAAQERAYYTRVNSVAIHQWLEDGNLSSSEKIQTLAQCIHDVATLTAPEGRVCIAIGQFETWFQRMTLISNRRSLGVALTDYQDALIIPLGQEWRDLIAILQRKLDHISRVLDNLGSAQEGTSLAMVLDAHKLFVGNLRQELEYCSAIERSTLEQEQTWVAESIVKIMKEDDPIAVNSRNNGLRQGIWNIHMT
jgi:hypothetical protein